MALFANVTKTVTAIVTLAVAISPTNITQMADPRCGQYYTTIRGGYCNILVMKFRIPLADMFFVDKDVNANCNKILTEYSYYIKPIGDNKLFPSKLRSATGLPQSTRTVTVLDTSIGLKVTLTQIQRSSTQICQR